jgi:hypothetical protein
VYRSHLERLFKYTSLDIHPPAADPMTEHEQAVWLAKLTTFFEEHPEALGPLKNDDSPGGGLDQ